MLQEQAANRGWSITGLERTTEGWCPKDARAHPITQLDGGQASVDEGGAITLPHPFS